MGLAKYAEDNEEILYERISRKYDLWGVDPWTNTNVAYTTKLTDGYNKPSSFNSERR